MAAGDLGTFYSGSNISAAGTTQGTATPITTDTVNVTVPDVFNTGVILPTGPDYTRILVNHKTGASALNVYPPTGGQIDALGANTPKTSALANQTEFWSTESDNSQWYSR